MRRVWNAYAAAFLVVVLLGIIGGGIHNVRSARAATCTLAPTLSDITINQGLNTYSLWVRGKVALVRLYLTLPSCAVAGNAVALNSAQLTVTVKDAVSGITQSTTTIGPTPAIASPNPQITNKTALTDVSPSDPLFVIPGPTLAPAGDTNRLTVTLSATVGYQAVSPAAAAGSVTFTTLPGTRTAITKTVERRSNALRLLLVPLGNPLDSTSTSNVQNAMAMLSRVYPVPGGVGALNTTAADGGIRYSINATALNLGALGVSFPPLCISNQSFSTIKAQLAQFRTSWNAANDASHQADKVLGAVNVGDSTSSAANVNCFEGIASVSSPESFMRATAEPIAAMELAHTFGLEPLARSAGYHSYNTPADTATGDLHRGYNASTYAYLSDARSALKYTPAGWANNNVLLEPADWSNMLCQLGGQTTTECTVSNTTGTAVGVAAGVPGPAFNVNAVIDESGTHVTESFVANTFPTPPGPAASPYTIVQSIGGTILQTDHVTFSTDESVHGGPLDLNDLLPSSGLISVSVPFNANTTKIELKNGTSVLYTWSKSASPTLTNPLVTPGGGEGTTEVAPGGSFGTSKSIGTTVGYASNADIYFLADSTGSMSGAIANVKSNISSIIDSIPPSTNPRFGAGNYKDFPVGTCAICSSAAFENNAAIAENPPSFNDQSDPYGANATKAAVNNWLTGGGGDTPEAGFFGLDRIATPDSFFRSGSNRVVVWFGDNPSHDPVCQAVWGGTYDITQAKVLEELKAKGIKVMAISVNSGEGSMGLDGDPSPGASSNYTDCPSAGSTGQGTAIANGTGGVFKANVAPSEVSDAIIDSLKLRYTFAESSYSCTNNGLSMTFNPSSTTVTSGTTANIGETVNVAAGTSPGAYSCTVEFTRNGTLDTSLNQVIPVDVTGFTGPHALITWQDTNTNDKYDVALNCNGVKNILAVALTTQAYDTNAACPGGGGTYEILANSGWGQSTTQAGAVPGALTNPSTAIASIQNPTDGASFSQFDVIPLRGSATIDGSPTNDLHWSIDSNPVGDGASVNISGLALGSHTVTLVAGSNLATASANFTILADADHDGLAAPFEQILHDCAVSKGITTDGGDHDPTNGSLDYDGDGILNRDDPAPCTPATDYRGQGIFLPNPFSLSSSGNLSAGGIYVPGRDLTQVDKTTVRLTEIAGIKLATPIYASAWAFSGPFAVATFPKAPFVAFVTDPAHNLVGHTISITMEGAAPGPPSWNFSIPLSTKVVN